MKNNKILTFLLSALTAGSLISSTAFAKPVTLYDKAATTAKKVGNIDLTKGVIPIYQPKNSEWVKVADPNNGNVGWIKSKELNQSGTTSFSFKQKVYDNDDAPYNYQVFEFGSDKSWSNKDTHKELMKLQERQRDIEYSLGKSIQNMVNELHDVYESQSGFLQDARFPIIMPVVVVPTPMEPVKKKPGKKQ